MARSTSPAIDSRPDRFSLSGFLFRQAQALLGFAIFLMLALAVAALATWNVADPSYSYATGNAPTNVLGYSGAAFADIAMQFFGLASVIALPVGIYAAYRRGSFLDQAATTLAMLGASIPGFWLGLILMQIFAVRWGILPVSGYGGPDTSLLERIRHLILPAVALGLVSSALIMRFTRASISVLASPWTRRGEAIFS